MVFDARKAHLHTYAEREIFIELPPERRRPGVCGRLVRCLRGASDAPALWERYLSSRLEAIGFLPGKANPCLFR
eukprot:11206700-Lingulodinium_polyedra.AAC.1